MSSETWVGATITEVETVITALLEGEATASYSLNGQSVTRESIADLMAFRRTLLEEQAGYSGSTGPLKVSFRRPSSRSASELL